MYIVTRNSPRSIDRLAEDTQTLGNKVVEDAKGDGDTLASNENLETKPDLTKLERADRKTLFFKMHKTV